MYPSIAQDGYPTAGNETNLNQHYVPDNERISIS